MLYDQYKEGIESKNWNPTMGIGIGKRAIISSFFDCGFGLILDGKLWNMN